MALRAGAAAALVVGPAEPTTEKLAGPSQGATRNFKHPPAGREREEEVGGRHFTKWWAW